MKPVPLSHYNGPMKSRQANQISGNKLPSAIKYFLIALPLTAFLSACSPPESDQQQATNKTVLQQARVYQQPMRLTDFALHDHLGNPFNRERLGNHWSLMFFGFTRCPDICPPTLSQLAAVKNTLDQEDTPPLQIIFISVDPAHDGRGDTLANYVKSFQADIIGATGPVAQINALTTQLGLYYRIESDHSRHGARHAMNAHDDNASDDSHGEAGLAADSRVDHSGTVLLINPKARLYAVFPPPIEQPAVLLNDLRMLLREGT